MTNTLLSVLAKARLVQRRIMRPLTVGVRCAVEQADGRILLVRHTYREGWFLPGGGVEKGETLEAAILRELWEEVGVRPGERPNIFHAYSNFREYKSDHVILFRLKSFSIEPNPNMEIAESDFFDLAALPKDTSPATRRRLMELRGEASPGEMW